jgi:hypothetical protein
MMRCHGTGLYGTRGLYGTMPSGVVDPVMCVGDNAAVPEGERLSSMARLALLLCFVIVERQRKLYFFCWVIVAGGLQGYRIKPG